MMVRLFLPFSFADKNYLWRRVLVLLLFGAFIAAVFNFDNLTPGLDFDDEIYYVAGLANGKALYHEVYTAYPPLAYWLALGVQRVTGLAPDDAVQVYAIAATLTTYLVFCAFVLALWPHHKAAALLLAGGAALPAFTLSTIMLTWRLGNMLGTLASLLLLWVIWRGHWPQTAVLGLGLAVAAMVSKQTHGLALFSALVFYLALKNAQVPGRSPARTVAQIAFGGAVLTLAFVVLLTVVWSFGVGPETNLMRQVLLPIELLARHRAYYHFGLESLGLWFGEVLRGNRAYWILFLAPVNYLAKLPVLGLAGWGLWREWQAGRGLSAAALRYLVVGYLNLAYAALIDHPLQGILDWPVTLASLMLLGAQLVQAGWQPRLAPVLKRGLWYGALWVTVIVVQGIGLFTAARVLVVAPVAPLAEIQPNFRLFAMPADLAAMHQLRDDMALVMPKAAHQRIWIIDGGGVSFTYLLAGIPCCTVLHPYPYFQAVNPATEGSYLAALEAQAFDYILIGRAGELFGLPVDTLYLPETAPPDNAAIWRLIREKYTHMADVPYPQGPAWQFPAPLPAYQVYQPK